MARVVQARGVGGEAPGRARRGRATPPDGPVRPGARGSRSCGATRSPLLEARGRAIRDPVEKLRFLRRSLERYETLDEQLQAVPGAPLRWLAFRLTGVEEARPLFSANPWGALDPPAAPATAAPPPGPPGRERGRA